jgi:hypothetical protein
MHAGLSGLHRVVLIMNRRRWTCKIEDAARLDIERKSYVMAVEFKAVGTKKMPNILFPARE